MKAIQEIGLLLCAGIFSILTAAALIIIAGAFNIVLDAILLVIGKDAMLYVLFALLTLLVFIPIREVLK